MNYQRKSYELFQEQSKQLSDYNKSISEPNTYGNEVFRLLKNNNFTNAKQACVDNKELIFKNFYMGDSCSDTMFQILDLYRKN